MKRMHIHIAVEDLDRAINFYTAMFASPPAKQKPDYAKWDLQEPAVNFAVSQRGHKAGINHLGIQMESTEDLQALSQRLQQVGIDYSTEDAATCCYAQANKRWIVDPVGMAWEAFETIGDAEVFGEDYQTESGACCVPMHQRNDGDDCCVGAGAGAQCC